ncbi:hypothetical protein AOQ84DRAFT_101885 [Glonium stellatum]|uniref:Uncharacterized protein n=1 Tax=Glonium stellatum TaxID=574774 RepID=A0A8E2EUR1_9PEZI|nr:hypothetical protein AOQ84DRAFT_101885 [Glonium stellatum]
MASASHLCRLCCPVRTHHNFAGYKFCTTLSAVVIGVLEWQSFAFSNISYLHICLHRRRAHSADRSIYMVSKELLKPCSTHNSARLLLNGLAGRPWAVFR